MVPLKESNMNDLRELNAVELEAVSGGTIYKNTVGGFTFTHNDKTGETTVGAGGIEVTTEIGPNGRTRSISW